ncbi:MAG: hypothetical protein QXN56_04180 [Candidatus Hadarchaeum sp.]
MSFCVNCGAEYERQQPCCERCLADQTVPNEILERELARFRHDPSGPGDPPFGDPGETTALILALASSFILLAFLRAASSGLFLLVVVLSLGLRLADIATAPRRIIKVGETCFPNVWKLAKLAAYRLRMPVPEVFIVHCSEYNAFTAGFLSKG